MGEIFRAFHVGGLQEWPTQVVGSGQSIAYSATPNLAGVPGDVRITLANQNAVYVEKILTWATNPTSFRFRIYYDFTGLAMAEGDQFDWLHIRSSASSYQIIGAALNYSSGALKNRFYSYEDGGANFNGLTVAMSSQRSWIELFCTLASNSSAADGALYAYEGGALVYSRTSYQQYDSVLEGPKLRIGGIAGMDAGTSGTLDFGKIVLASNSDAIGAHNPNQLVHLWMPPGNELTQWTSGSTGSGQSVAYDGTTALGGVAGDLEVTIANQNDVYKSLSGIDLSTAAYVRIKFQLDSSALTMASDGLFTLAALKSSAGGYRIGCAYGSTSGQHYIQFNKLDDGGVASTSDSQNISAGTHLIEWVLQKASSSTASDGVATYYVDGGEVASRTGLDIYDDFATLSDLYFGPNSQVSALDSGTTGTLVMGKLSVLANNYTGTDLQVTFLANEGIFDAPTPTNLTVYGEHTEYMALEGSVSDLNTYFSSGNGPRYTHTASNHTADLLTVEADDGIAAPVSDTIAVTAVDWKITGASLAAVNETFQALQVTAAAVGETVLSLYTEDSGGRTGSATATLTATAQTPAAGSVWVSLGLDVGIHV